MLKTTEIKNDDMMNNDSEVCVGKQIMNCDVFMFIYYVIYTKTEYNQLLDVDVNVVRLIEVTFYT